MPKELTLPLQLPRPLDHLRVLEDHVHQHTRLAFLRPTALRILFVCEGLAFDSPNGFSFKLVIDALRDDSAVKYANFRLTLATWAANPASVVQKDSSPSDYQATYTNFRFASRDPDDNALILGKFDEVWLFGISPNTNFPVDAASILGSSVCPTQNDVVELTRWMNAGGGVLAMGDHASLGAHLCARVPRVWTMRRWTQEDGAPPRIGTARVDTNQPMWASQDPELAAVPDEIPFEAQSDDVPQRIEVRRYRASRGFAKVSRPHPILCGGKLGTLDVLPDHPHEGWVNEDADIDLTASVLITSPPADLEAREYPTIGGVQPKPQVIAWGNTLDAPPHLQEKGPTTVKRFGVIGAYDGHPIEFGRVVVDSTWHHWMSVNLSGSYATTDGDPDVPGTQPLVGLKEADNTANRKVLAYYRNVAVWLAPRKKQERMLAYVSWWAALSTHTFEDWRPDTPAFVLGAEAKEVLSKSVSACTLSRWFLELVPERLRPLIPELQERFDPRDPFGPICLSCPDVEHLESLAFGILLQKMMQLRDEVKSGAKDFDRLTEEDFDAKLMSRLDAARKDASEMILERLQKELKVRTRGELPGNRAPGQ